MFTYFEKPMNTAYTTLESSAMCPEQKKQQHSQEVVRRLSRMDTRRPPEEKTRVLDDFTDKMIRSGFSVKRVRQIIISGVRCYKRSQ